MIEEIFDKEQEYKNKILPLVNNLKNECNKLGIPVFISACVKNNKKETVYKNEMVSAAASEVDLHDDKFIDFTNVINGFTTVPKSYQKTFENFDIDF